jgi:hypothetical protein
MLAYIFFICNETCVYMSMYFRDHFTFSLYTISNISMGSIQISEVRVTLAPFNMTENFSSNNLKRYVTFHLLIPLMNTNLENKLNCISVTCYVFLTH